MFPKPTRKQKKTKIEKIKVAQGYQSELVGWSARKYFNLAVAEEFLKDWLTSPIRDNVFISKLPANPKNFIFLSLYL